MKLLNSNAEIHGIDPDKIVLQKAQAKAQKYSVNIFFHKGFLSLESASDLGCFSKVVSSLVFHQTPMEEKRNILFSITKLLEPNGLLCIVDCGLQRGALMKILFRGTVQAIDGVEDTQRNAEGCLPELMKNVGFVEVSEAQVISTLTGSISIYTAKLVT